MVAGAGGATKTDLYLFQLAQTQEGQRKLRLAFPDLFPGSGGGVSSITSNPLLTGGLGASAGANRDAVFNAKIAQFDQKYGSLVSMGLQTSPEAAALYQRAQVGALQQQLTGQSNIPALGALGVLESLGLGGRLGAGGVIGNPSLVGNQFAGFPGIGTGAGTNPFTAIGAGGLGGQQQGLGQVMALFTQLLGGGQQQSFLGGGIPQQQGGGNLQSMLFGFANMLQGLLAQMGGARR